MTFIIGSIFYKGLKREIVRNVQIRKHLFLELIKCAIQYGNYRWEELHKLIKLVNKYAAYCMLEHQKIFYIKIYIKMFFVRLTPREREKNSFHCAIALMLVDGLKNRISMSLGAFFRLIDLLLLDNYSKLMMDEKMELFIYGEMREKITSDQYQVLTLLLQN